MNRTVIEEAYKKLGYKRGWRFMTCPERNLASSRIVVVTLNPAGHAPGGPDWSCEKGSAYVIEAWPKQITRNKQTAPIDTLSPDKLPKRPVGRAPLQIQFQRMCALLPVDPNNVFSAYFVPFRSPRWDQLENEDDALAFARGLWRWVFTRSPAKTIYCIGKNAAHREILNLLAARHVEDIPTGWGNIRVDVSANKDGYRVIGLPHLSTFKIFGRGEFDGVFRKRLRP